MPRAKRGFTRRRRVKAILDRAEGFVLGRKNMWRRACEAVDRAATYAYRDRRVKKRDFRRLWISRIGAAASANDMSYSRLQFALKKTNIELNRKMLSEIAREYPDSFERIVKKIS